MKRWLQEFSFKKSFYERPNQKWVCGRACLGEGCLAGPDAQGNCGATAECRPLRKGDRWHCTRPAMRGGPCPDGPRPDGSCCRPVPTCSPVRSLRAWRGLAVLLVLAASVSFVFFLLASKRGASILSPGELTFAHASAGSKCSDCHAGTENNPASWLTDEKHPHAGDADNALCLRCHNVGSEPMLAHSLPNQKIQPLTRAAREKTGSTPVPVGLQFASLLSGGSHAAEGHLACASCHKEHRGQDSNLKTLSNSQCQSCHAIQFDRLSQGHPEFTKYPFDRRTRIIFDHESHLKTHFTQEQWKNSAPGSCLDCHQTDLKGGVMELKPFAAICASCHESQIKGKGSVNPGITFITIPRLDERVLVDEFAIGQWPEDAEQPLTPFLKLLLSSDPLLRGALDKLGDTDLSDLPKTDVEKIKAAQQVAWGIKGLILDLGTMGQEELIKRIEASLNRPLSNQDREGAAALLSSEVLRMSFQSSFPKLQEEVADYRAKKEPAETDLVPSPPLASGKSKTATPDSWVESGGWYRPESGFTLSYRPHGHSDNFLASWMNLTVEPDKSVSPAAAKAVFDEIAGPKAAGFCAKCHSVDNAPSDLVNWFGAKPNPDEHKFNRFSHSTHMSLLNDTGCFTCHSMKETGATPSYASSFENGQRDPAQFHSNFQTIKKESCATCHRPQFANDNCLLCHNYHVGDFRATVPQRAPTSSGPLFKAAQEKY